MIAKSGLVYRHSIRHISLCLLFSRAAWSFEGRLHRLRLHESGRGEKEATDPSHLDLSYSEEADDSIYWTLVWFESLYAHDSRRQLVFPVQPRDDKYWNGDGQSFGAAETL